MRKPAISNPLQVIAPQLPDITTLVTFGALGLFVWLAGPAVGTALKGAIAGRADLDSVTATAILLNIGLIALGWRRNRALAGERAARSVAEHRARRAAHEDYVTGLLNRRGFVKALERHLGRGKPAALVLLDLDHFKRINDMYGHGAGDAVIKLVGDLLHRLSPARARIARVGGDEFAILMHGADASPEIPSALAEAIIASLSEPLVAGGLETKIGVSIGIAVDEAGTEDASTLMRRSDIAMYDAKARGRNGIAWFDRSMEEELRRRNTLEADMRSGIAAGAFVPFYQPQVDLGTGELHGFEVLARWWHPENGLLEPAQFIPIAEATGLIAPLSLSVMRQALIEALDWNSRLMIAVNVSPVQLKDPLLAQHIMKLLAETGFPAHRLELEVTESSLFEDLDLALSTITSLKHLGVTISLDDFGTGYSSLTQLQTLPFDRIKIDRSFVMTMLDNHESAAIVNAIASLGESLSLPITAEGIESSAIRDSLQAVGCSQGQGWHFGRPLPGSEIEKLVGIKQAATPDAAIKSVKIAGAGMPAAGTKERRDRKRRGGRRAA